jgi:uncharacterized FlaG/YvyC family protein
MKYTKESARITVKFIDADTEEILFEIDNRTWMNVGDVFSDHITTELMKDKFKNRKMPENIMVLAVGEYSQK